MSDLVLLPVFAVAAWGSGVAGSLAVSLLALTLHVAGRDRWPWTEELVDEPVGAWLRDEVMEALTWPIAVTRAIVVVTRHLITAARNRGEGE